MDDIRIDFRGSQHLPARPRSLECDFCGREDLALWCFICRPFGVRFKHHRFELPDINTWNGCVECLPFLETRSLDGLVERVQRTNHYGMAMAREYFVFIYAAIMGAMVDRPPVRWNSGDPFPVL